MSVENNHRRFLYQRLYDYVLDEIRTGRLSTGDRVPSEMELAQLFGVSRITSKKALQTLNRDGVESDVPDLYSKASPGSSRGVLPTTPGPFTSCRRPRPSVIFQWRLRNCTAVSPLFSIRTL